MHETRGVRPCCVRHCPNLTSDLCLGCGTVVGDAVLHRLGCRCLRRRQLGLGIGHVVRKTPGRRRRLVGIVLEYRKSIDELVQIADVVDGSVGVVRHRVGQARVYRGQDKIDVQLVVC